MSGTQIAKINAARRALAAAKSVDDVKKVVGLADALLAAARKLSDKNKQIEIAELRFRALRQLGQMIDIQRRTIGLAKGGRPSKTGSKLDPVSKRLTLSEAGVDKHLAHEARQMADMSDEMFDKFLFVWRKRSELENKRVTTTLMRPSSKDIKSEQRELFDPSHSYLAWNGQKLERVRLKNSLAPDWLKLAETTDSMVGMIAATVRRLNRLAIRAGDLKSIDKFQKMFAKLAADIERLSDQYWWIRSLLAESKPESKHHMPPEYDPELERRGLWPPQKTDDDIEKSPF